MRGGKKGRSAEDGALRGRRYPVSLSPSEEVRVIRAAGGRPIATWMREQVLAAAPSIVDDPEALERAIEAHEK